MNKKEEALVKEVVADLVPEREHSPNCVNLFIFGYPHENCDCKCHKKKGSPNPSKEKRSSAV